MCDVKVCTKCKIPQPATTQFFYRSTKCGLSYWCKTCESKKHAAKRKTRPVHFSATEKQCSKCREIKTHSEFHPRLSSPTRLAPYCILCHRLAVKASNLKHREKLRAKEKSRIDSCPATQMKYRILGLVRKAIDRHALALPVSSVTREFWQAVGYTRAELAEHIEKQFLPGMTWVNRKLWHIDHIVPVSYFRPTSFCDPKFLACWGLNNLRPMWASDNIRKRASLEFLNLME